MAGGGRLQVPEGVQHTLDNGLSVRAFRMPSSRLVELRLRIPFAGADPATAVLLAESLVTGTDTASHSELVGSLREVGAQISATADADHLQVEASTLAHGLDRLLATLSTVLRRAAYPDAAVAAKRDSCAERLKVFTTQPATMATQALNRRLYGDHPYATSIPTAGEVLGVNTADVRSLHYSRLTAEGAQLILVGDLDARDAARKVERNLGGWEQGGPMIEHPEPPDVEKPATVVSQRPGAAQSRIRIGFYAVPRAHPHFSSLQLANMIFGGYFSSLLVTGLREQKGFAYTPKSSLVHLRACSVIGVLVDVATAVTVPALREITEQLEHASLLDPEPKALDRAKSYTIGTMQLSLSTQVGLATMAANLASAGLELRWLAEHFDRLASLDAQSVGAAAARYLAPECAVTAVLGDTDAFAHELAHAGSDSP